MQNECKGLLLNRRSITSNHVGHHPNSLVSTNLLLSNTAKRWKTEKNPNRTLLNWFQNRMVRFTLLARNNPRWTVILSTSACLPNSKSAKNGCFCCLPWKYQHARQHLTKQSRVLEFRRKLARKKRLLTPNGHSEQDKLLSAAPLSRSGRVGAGRERRHLPMCASDAFHVWTHRELSWL